MKKHLKNPSVIESQTLVISARGQILGRLATQVADALRGKDTPHFVPHLLSGRKVIVTHAKDIQVTGRKLDQKRYYHHSGYIGGLKEETLRNVLKRDAPEVIRRAVSGMLPHNRLHQHWLNALEIRDEE